MNCSRRDFFGRVGRGLVGEVVQTAGALRQGVVRAVLVENEPPETERLWLRPPGALPEASFLEACTRCTDCQQACPYDSIRRLGPEFGAAAETPAIIASESPCYLCRDMPCIAACEPRALLPVMRHDVRMGRAVVDLDRCYLSRKQPCDYCVVRCPIGDVAIRFDADGLPEVVEDRCTGCGVCAYLCPGTAIRIKPFQRGSE